VEKAKVSGKLRHRKIYMARTQYGTYSNVHRVPLFRSPSMLI